MRQEFATAERQKLDFAGGYKFRPSRLTFLSIGSKSLNLRKKAGVKFSDIFL